MDFLQRTPVFRLLLPFIVGIVFYQYVELFQWSLFALTGLSAGLVLFGLIIRKPNLQFQFRWLFGLGIFLFLFVLGYFISDRYSQLHSFQYLDKKGIFTVEITDTPLEKDKSILCRIKTLQFFDSLQTNSSRGKALIYIQKSKAASLLCTGDRLLVETTFKKPDGVLNPEGFNYKNYLSRQGIGATVYIADSNWKKIGRNTSFSILRMAEQTQKKLLSIYKDFGITGDEFAVLAALTLGSKDALHPDLRQNYTTSGGMHILAVSGLHVGIIYMVLLFLLSFLDNKSSLKVFKSILIVLLLWLYAFITGLPPSVIRATIMFSFVAIGAGLERKSQIYNTISIAAFLMLLYNPNYLFDVGFQLSFSAVVSIVYFQPKIQKWFVVKNRALDWLWKLTSVSLAAQIGTAPYSLFYFHQFASYFLVTNIIAIPFATFIIYGAVILFTLSPIPYVSGLVAFVLYWLLKVLNFSIEFIHNLPFSLYVASIDFWQVVCIFATVILFAVYSQTKKFIPFFSALLLILIYISINLSMQYQTLNTSRMVVFSDNTNLHVDFIDGKKHYLFTSDSKSINRVAGSFWLYNKLDVPSNIMDEGLMSDGFIEFKGKRFFILFEDKFKNKISSSPFLIDYLIVGNGLKPNTKEILRCVKPRMIIVDRSISQWYTDKIRKSCAERSIAFYSIAEQGAYILNFTH